MAIKFVSAKCPECGAALNVEEGRKQTFCEYCGANILIYDDNEPAPKKTNIKKSKPPKINQNIRMKEIEIEERQRLADAKQKADLERQKSSTNKTAIVLAIVGILLMAESSGGGLIFIIIAICIWYSSKNNPPKTIRFSNNRSTNEFFSNRTRVSKPYIKAPTFTVKVPRSINGFQSKNYTDIEAMFTSAGFTNVKCIPLNDLRMGVLTSPSKVDSITINGQEIHGGGKKFPKNANVIISYHSLYHK